MTPIEVLQYLQLIFDKCLYEEPLYVEVSFLTLVDIIEVYVMITVTFIFIGLDSTSYPWISLHNIYYSKSL